MSYHIAHFVIRSISFYALAAALVILPGCDDGGHAAGDQTAVSSQEEREYVTDLAWRYLQEEVDEDGARQIQDEIEALSPSQMRLMNKELQHLGDADPRQVQLGDRLTELAIERGVPMFTASQEDIGRIVAEIGDDVTPRRSLCQKWKPPSTTSLQFFNSSAAGVTPSLYDRRSTGYFEWNGCDHRFYFSGWRIYIDGKSTAYDNWIKSYPSILGHHTGLNTYALMGNNMAENAGIYNVSKSMLKAY